MANGSSRSSFLQHRVQELIGLRASCLLVLTGTTKSATTLCSLLMAPTLHFGGFMKGPLALWVLVKSLITVRNLYGTTECLLCGVFQMLHWLPRCWTSTPSTLLLLLHTRTAPTTRRWKRRCWTLRTHRWMCFTITSRSQHMDVDATMIQRPSSQQTMGIIRG